MMLLKTKQGSHVFVSSTNHQHRVKDKLDRKHKMAVQIRNSVQSMSVKKNNGSHKNLQICFVKKKKKKYKSAEV